MGLTEIRRGELWWVALDPAAGSETRKTRPCVIMQRDSANQTSSTTIVCPITSARGRKASIINVLLQAGTGGLRKESVVVCNQLRTVDRERFETRIGALDAMRMQDVERGVRAILDL